MHAQPEIARTAADSALRHVPAAGADALPSDLERALWLRRLRSSDAAGFWRLLLAHAEALLPVVYTPTIGDVASQYHMLRLQPQGLYVSSRDAGRVAERLRAWPFPLMRRSCRAWLYAFALLSC